MPEYIISTGLVKIGPKQYPDYKTAWDHLANDLDKVYKTGRSVIGVLYRVDISKVMSIHPDGMDFDIHVEVPLFSGYISKSYEGEPWNNPVKPK